MNEFPPESPAAALEHALDRALERSLRPPLRAGLRRALLAAIARISRLVRSGIGAAVAPACGAVSWWPRSALARRLS